MSTNAGGKPEPTAEKKTARNPLLRWLALGTLLIFGLNLIRIVTMLHLVSVRPEWFEVAHGLIWQSIMVVSVALFVMVQFETRPVPSRPEGAAP